MTRGQALSRDGFTMLFGSDRAGTEGASDIYMASREKLRGHRIAATMRTIDGRTVRLDGSDQVSNSY